MNQSKRPSIEMSNSIGMTNSIDMINSMGLSNSTGTSNQIKINKYIIILNILIILFTIPVMFGIGFGIAHPIRTNANNQVETKCINNGTFQEEYYCCNKICNDTLPSCDDMVNLNINGKCCDGVNCTVSDICYIYCGDCSRIGITFTYDSYYKNITYNCANNETCVYNRLNISELKCWYDKTNISNVSFSEPEKVQWYIYYIIALLGFLCVTLLIAVNILSNFISNIEK